MLLTDARAMHLDTAASGTARARTVGLDRVVFASPCSAQINRSGTRRHLETAAQPALAILPFPRNRSRSIFADRPAGCPLVRSRLCRRHPARMALCPAASRSNDVALAQRQYLADQPWRSSTTSCVWAAGGIVLGGRIGYILFYDLPAPCSKTRSARIEIWNGGMSFHGGFHRHDDRHDPLCAQERHRRSGACSTSSLPWCRSACSSAASPTSSTANSGAGCTSVPWAIVFPTGGPFARHPSQLYEAALEGHRAARRHSPGSSIGRQALKSPGLVTGIFVLRLCR